jgi:UDP-N-acetylmuramoylalanine--D-glutamate ligase
VDFLQGKRILVLGLARSGISAAELCIAEGAQITGYDQKRREEIGESCDHLESLGADLCPGQEPDPTDFDLVVTSPGIPPRNAILQAARESGIPVWSEMELAGRCARCHLVAVTGTDGKSTVSTMVRDLLHAHRKRTFLGGNMEPPFSAMLLHKDFVHTPHVVLEASSFQLEFTETFRPEVAAILNIASDHQKWHGSAEAYRRAKWKIAANLNPDSFLVLRSDLAHEIPTDYPGYPLFFGMKDTGQEGAFWHKGQIRWRFMDEVIDVPFKSKRKFMKPELENVVAALTIGMAAGTELHKSIGVLEKFQSLPHRLEAVGEKNEVRYVNNSKATNVHSAIAAIRSVEGPIVLIAGGQDKEEDFAPLAEAAKGRVREAILLGETANTLAAHLIDHVRVQRVATLYEAVVRARGVAKPGSTVLFAPACPSFDMYENFEERGEEFNRLVKQSIEP